MSEAGEVSLESGSPFKKHIDCSECIAACCRAGIIHKLNATDAARMQSSGTTMEIVRIPPSRRGPVAVFLGSIGFRRQQESTSDDQLYLLMSDCGNLASDPDETGRVPCQDYENRPPGCKELEPGSLACRQARVAAGLDEPHEVVFFRAYHGNT